MFLDAKILAQQYQLPQRTVQEIIGDEVRASLLRSPMGWVLFGLGIAACVATWVFHASFSPMVASAFCFAWVLHGRHLARNRIRVALEEKQQRVWGDATRPEQGDAR